MSAFYIHKGNSNYENKQSDRRVDLILAQAIEKYNSEGKYNMIINKSSGLSLNSYFRLLREEHSNSGINRTEAVAILQLQAEPVSYLKVLFSPNKTNCSLFLEWGRHLTTWLHVSVSCKALRHVLREAFLWVSVSQRRNYQHLLKTVLLVEVRVMWLMICKHQALRTYHLVSFWTTCLHIQSRTAANTLNLCVINEK